MRLTIENTISSLKTFPMSRLYFITIRDPHQTWKLDKVRSWVRRYSDIYVIVSSPVGGTHFHILLGAKTHSVLTAVKGIHFDIKPIQARKTIIFDERWEADEERKEAHLHREYVLSLFPLDEQSEMRSSILRQEKLNRSQRAKARTAIRLTEAEQRVESVITYLQKNVMENPEGPILFVNYVQGKGNP